MATDTSKKTAFGNSVMLARAALRIARDDKKVFGLAALSGLVSLLLIGGLITTLIIFWSTAQMVVLQGVPRWVYYGAGAIIAFIAFYAGSFFNAAITHIALRRFDGEHMTFNQALRAAARKWTPLLGLAGLTATVGLVLRLIGEVVPYVGWGATWLGGVAWNVASIFAVQVIMNDDETNSVQAVKRSSKTFAAIWKESIFVGLSLGLVSIITTIVLMIIVLGLIVMAAVLQMLVLVPIAVGLLVAVTISLVLIMTALRAIVMSAAYYYAVNGRVPAGFDEELIRKAFQPKKKWLQV